MTMTTEEMKKMVGTEFIFEFEDGDTVLGYITAFDPGDDTRHPRLTCNSLQTTTAFGHIPPPRHLEEDGTFCLLSFVTMERITTLMEEVAATGTYHQNLAGEDSSSLPQCHFKG